MNDEMTGASLCPSDQKSLDADKLRRRSLSRFIALSWFFESTFVFFDQVPYDGVPYISFSANLRNWPTLRMCL
jgi:hypothetical protein